MAADRHPGPGDDRTTARDALHDLVARVRPELVRAQESGDRDAGLDLIAFTQVLSEEAATMRDDAVASARHQKTSWAQIGDRLGMSRQAAQQRFGDPGPDDHDRVSDPAHAAVGEVWRLSPVTAFDEMEQLDHYGRQGWHSVGYGILFHDLVKDSVAWEHRRVSVLGPGRARLEADGWRVVGGGWFPWSYYARPTGRPAES